jgi:uncharacterized protein
VTPAFEFDPEKSAANLAKHGIDFVQAQRLWSDARLIIGPSDYPDEARLLAIGRLDGKLWTAVVTLRDEMIRIISVRRSRQAEVEGYERTS